MCCELKKNYRKISTHLVIYIFIQTIGNLRPAKIYMQVEAQNLKPHKFRPFYNSHEPLCTWSGSL